MINNIFQTTNFSKRSLISQITFLLIVAILLFVSSAGCKTTNTSSVQDTEQLMPNLLRPERVEVPQKTIISIPGEGQIPSP